MTPSGQQKGTCLQSWPLAGNDTSPWTRSQERNCLWVSWACSQRPTSKPVFLEPGPCYSKGCQAGIPHSGTEIYPTWLEWFLVPKTQSHSSYCYYWHLGTGQVMPMHLEPLPSSGLNIWSQVPGAKCQVPGARCQTGSCAVNLHGETSLK